jgi:hypothetical protein
MVIHDADSVLSRRARSQIEEGKAALGVAVIGTNDRQCGKQYLGSAPNMYRYRTMHMRLTIAQLVSQRHGGKGILTL